MKPNNISKTGRAQMMPPAIFLLLLVLVGGCATSGNMRQTQPGDTADIHFQCRLQNSEIAAATDDNTVKKDQPKANIYVVRLKNDPVSVLVPGPSEKPAGEKERTFEDDIAVRLAGHLTGLKEGETRHVELTAQDLPERTKENYTVSLARVQKTPKEIKITIEEYKSRTGMSPETGKSFVYDPAVPGHVESVTGNDVIIRFSAEDGAVVQTPFGVGRIREEADAYKVDIDARKGSLIRSGPLVGRITDVDDKFMVIDYRNPFGGETLSCDVTVSKITEKVTEKVTEAEAKKAQKEGTVEE
jgi:FKBP-type peptidyl-prolyl cis-trans isomerase 2